MEQSSATKTVVCLVLGALAVLAWGIAFGAIKQDVTHIDKRCSDNTEQLREHGHRYIMFGEKLTRIDTRQETMIKSLDELSAELRNEDPN